MPVCVHLCARVHARVHVRVHARVFSDVICAGGQLLQALPSRVAAVKPHGLGSVASWGFLLHVCSVRSRLNKTPVLLYPSSCCAVLSGEMVGSVQPLAAVPSAVDTHIHAQHDQQQHQHSPQPAGRQIRHGQISRALQLMLHLEHASHDRVHRSGKSITNQNTIVHQSISPTQPKCMPRMGA